MSQENLLIIGSGIAGLACAWLLRERYHIQLIEKNDYLGGHSHTVTFADGQTPVAVDTGFMVFNPGNYPQLIALFKELGVTSYDTDMSFAASIHGELEYSSSALFGQKKNFFRPQHWHFLSEIVRFNTLAKKSLAKNAETLTLTLGDYLSTHKFSQAFQNNYILPMAAAIWSCSTEMMQHFPVESFLRFFANHGLLNNLQRPIWQTVQGGSHSYVKKIHDDLQKLGHEIYFNQPAERLVRAANSVQVHSQNGQIFHGEQVILACHADEALALLAAPSHWENKLLGSFHYQHNRTFLHRDATLMPKNRAVWASWNYLSRKQAEDSQKSEVFVTYWMNRLQNLPTQDNVFVSLNPPQTPEKVIKVMDYHHPSYDRAALQAQQHLPTLNGQQRTWYCGSYFGYGFHEDALKAALQVVKGLGGTIPWQVPQPADTLPTLTPAEAL